MVAKNIKRDEDLTNHGMKWQKHSAADTIEFQHKITQELIPVIVQFQGSRQVLIACFNFHQSQLSRRRLKNESAWLRENITLFQQLDVFLIDMKDFGGSQSIHLIRIGSTGRDYPSNPSFSNNLNRHALRPRSAAAQATI